MNQLYFIKKKASVVKKNTQSNHKMGKRTDISLKKIYR